jgi:hypothetical protein
MKGGAVNKLTALLFATLSLSLNAQVTLGPTVGTFGVLAGSTVTNTGPSVITGNVGLSPGTSVTGFPPGTVTGTIFTPNLPTSGNGVAAQAQTELTAAYNAAAGATSTGVLAGNLAGLTFTPGVYTNASSVQNSGIVTLSGAGQFIFQIGSTLTTATGSSVVLINGATPGNIFWQVGSSATLGTTSAFSGNILALTSITLTTGAVLQGRALARNGAVTLDSNNVKSA